MKKDISKVLVLLGLSALLVSLAYFLPNIVNKEEEGERKKVFRVNEDKAVKFRLQFGDSDIIAAKDTKSGKWKIERPGPYRASKLSCKGTIKDFNMLHIQGIVEEELEGEDYGFNSNISEFTIWEEGGKEYKILVGSKVLDSGYYVRYKDELIFVKDFFIEPLKKSISNLREDNFLDIDVVDLRAVVLDHEHGFIKSSRTDAVYNKIKTNLDVHKVFDLIQKVGVMRATRFLPEDSNPEDYNFDEAVHVGIKLADRTKRECLVSKKGEKVYAKVPDEPGIYEVHPRVYPLLMRRGKDYIKSTNENITNNALTNKSPDINPLKLPEKK